jgi:hypothetical protein
MFPALFQGNFSHFKYYQTGDILEYSNIYILRTIDITPHFVFICVCNVDQDTFNHTIIKMIDNSMVKSVLIYGAEIWILYEDDRRRINTTETDALRRSARTSKLDRKTNEYIRGKMDAQDMILDEITRKQLIWYGHVERMDPTRVPKIMFHWEPKGRKKRGRPRRTWKEGIYRAMNETDEWNNRGQWSVAAGRHRQTL